jgi:hypothetical protein
VALRFERIWGPSVCCDRSFAQRRSGFRLQAPASLAPAKRLNLWPSGSRGSGGLQFAVTDPSRSGAQDFGYRLPLRSRLQNASTCGPQGSRGSEGLQELK